MNLAAATTAALGQQGIAFHSKRACLTASRPGIPCTACAEICPEHAIRVAERKVHIDPAACSGCGRCATVCPTGAVSLPAVPSSSLYECRRVRKVETGASSVSCLGGLTAATLRDALASGDVTLIDRGWCKNCPVSGGQASPWEDTLRAVNGEAETLGIAARVRVRRNTTASWRARAAHRGRSDNPARRALFTRMAQAGQAVAPVDPLAGLPDRIETPGPRKRAAQLAQLAGDKTLPASLFPALNLSGQPRDLNILATLCPTEALYVVETGTGTIGTATLMFDAAACIACGDCTSTGALSLMPSRDAPYAGPEALVTLTRATCARCRARFTPKRNQTVCDACARDTDLAALAHGLRRRRDM